MSCVRRGISARRPRALGTHPRTERSGVDEAEGDRGRSRSVAANVGCDHAQSAVAFGATLVANPAIEIARLDLERDDPLRQCGRLRSRFAIDEERVDMGRRENAGYKSRDLRERDFRTTKRANRTGRLAASCPSCDRTQDSPDPAGLTQQIAQERSWQTKGFA